MSLPSISVQFGCGLKGTTYSISNIFENFTQHPMENGMLCIYYMYVDVHVYLHINGVCFGIYSKWSIDFY